MVVHDCSAQIYGSESRSRQADEKPTKPLLRCPHNALWECKCSQMDVSLLEKDGPRAE